MVLTGTALSADERDSLLRLLRWINRSYIEKEKKEKGDE